MQAWHNELASPPTQYIRPYPLDRSQTNDSDSLASVTSSISSQASATSLSSTWTAPSSQEPDYTPTSVSASESDCGEAQLRSLKGRLVPGKQFENQVGPCFGLDKLSATHLSNTTAEVSHELRRNPRRTSAATLASRGGPPTLFRQVDRKVEFVDKLVDSATYIVEAIWPTSSVPCRNDFGTSTSVLPLRKFIEETLRRSRTSYSTLQVGLYYLILIKPHIPSHDFTMEQTDESHASRVLQCGRRMFLAALILASKWLQDRNYSARAWSKISGLKISEINENELAFLATVNWKLHVSEDLYNTWSDCVMKHTPSLPPSPGGSVASRYVFQRECIAFKMLISGLTPELDNIDYLQDEFEATMSNVVPGRKPFSGHVSQGRRTVGNLDCIRKPVVTSYPSVMEPEPTSPCSPGRQVPALGLLPPRRAAYEARSRLNTPAVSFGSQLRGYSMSTAMTCVGSVSAAQNLERFPIPAPTLRASPQSYAPSRRSSLANTVSTASSPESMVSDSSGNSRSSSISSVSLSQNAPVYMQARRAIAERQRMTWNEQPYRTNQLIIDGNKLKPVLGDMLDITDPFYPGGQTMSPEPYISLPQVENIRPTTAIQESNTDQASHISVRQAACALQELHNHRDVEQQTPQQPAWLITPVQAPKRKRPESLDQDSVLQDKVRNLLARDITAADDNNSNNQTWSDSLLGASMVPYGYPTPSYEGQRIWSPHPSSSSSSNSTPTGATENQAPSKRVCRSTPDLYQPHLKESYGQHHLVLTM